MSETNVLVFKGTPVLVAREPELLNEAMATYTKDDQAAMHIVFGVPELE